MLICMTCWESGGKSQSNAASEPLKKSCSSNTALVSRICSMHYKAMWRFGLYFTSSLTVISSVIVSMRHVKLSAWFQVSNSGQTKV